MNKFDIPGPSLPISEEIQSKKHRDTGESFRDAVSRQAGAMKDNDISYHKFRDIIMDQRFLSAGRIQASMGSTKNITAFNCFVSAVIEDNLTGPNGIMEQVVNAADTLRKGGGLGYDFSTIRPRGDTIVSLQSQASGPVSFMEIYDAVCKTIASAGHRRGAQMGVLRVDHPDIEEFIRAKQSHIHMPNLWEIVKNLPDDDPLKNKAFADLQKTNKLTTFNVSIAVTDEFMIAVENDSNFNLHWGGKVYKIIKARTLWEQIMRSTWDWGEPGVIFIDTINKMNNLWYCETIAATNPCGEQPLPPNGACLLGSFNATKYIRQAASPKEKSSWIFDWVQFKEDIPWVIRSMDNVIDRSQYPHEAQKKEALTKRRMGIGFTGLANAGEALGFLYGSKRFLQFITTIHEVLMIEAYKASVELAKEKGAFPLFDKDKYCQSELILRLPSELQELIYTHGIRNSHLLSDAPTGTISLAADNISSGIEPVFSYRFERTIMNFDEVTTEIVEDYGYRVFGVEGKRSVDCSIDDHLGVLLIASRYVDSAVSKTVNINGNTPWDEFKAIYFKAWKGGAKGCTTFNSDGKRTGILISKDRVFKTDKENIEENEKVCWVGEDGKKSCE